VGLVLATPGPWGGRQATPEKVSAISEDGSQATLQKTISLKNKIIFNPYFTNSKNIVKSGTKR
jgi:hypothetical protein